MNKRILLIGGGGHCLSVLDSLINSKEYSEIGIIDIKENVGKSLLGIPVLGTDDDLPRLYKEGFKNAFITIGSIGDSSIRVKLFNMIETLGFNSPNIIDKTAIVSKYAKLGCGIFIGKNAVINAGASISKGAIINTGSIIEHNNRIGDFTHIAPGVVICGDVSIGKYSHIGARSVVRQRITVGSNTTIGLGSNVLTNIKDDVVAYGNPCKEV